MVRVARVAVALMLLSPPPPALFAGTGTSVIFEPGFTVGSDGSTPTDPDIAHIYHLLDGNHAVVDDYTDGRDVHAGNYRGSCEINFEEQEVTRCSSGMIALHTGGVGGCADDAASTLDGLRVCSASFGGQGANVRFRLKYTATASDQNHRIDNLHLFLRVAKSSSNFEHDESGAAEGTDVGFAYPPTGSPWILPSGTYQVQLTIEDIGCEGSLTIGETENYQLVVTGSSVTLKTRDGGTSFTNLANCNTSIP